MGNCVFREYITTTKILDHHHQHHHQLDHDHNMIKVVTTNGGIMELYAPITAEHITSEFPGHALFNNPNSDPHPLLHKDHLHPGQLYYLLPLSTTACSAVKTNTTANTFRMSVDTPRVVMKKSDPDVVTRYSGTGVWKVRLVINPEQLSEILSQDATTEELIESVRTVAKCATTGGSTATLESGSNVDPGGGSTCNFQLKSSL